MKKKLLFLSFCLTSFNSAWCSAPSEERELAIRVTCQDNEPTRILAVDKKGKGALFTLGETLIALKDIQAVTIEKNKIIPSQDMDMSIRTDTYDFHYFLALSDNKPTHIPGYSEKINPKYFLTGNQTSYWHYKCSPLLDIKQPRLENSTLTFAKMTITQQHAQALDKVNKICPEIEDIELAPAKRSQICGWLCSLFTKNSKDE